MDVPPSVKISEKVVPTVVFPISAITPINSVTPLNEPDSIPLAFSLAIANLAIKSAIFCPMVGKLPVIPSPIPPTKLPIPLPNAFPIDAKRLPAFSIPPSGRYSESFPIAARRIAISAITAPTANTPTIADPAKAPAPANTFINMPITPNAPIPFSMVSMSKLLIASTTPLAT